MKKTEYILLFLFVSVYLINGQVSVRLIEKHFVKEKKVLFRIVPENKKMFDLIKTNALKVTRYNLNNGNLTNEVVINEMLKPYWEADTAKWMTLIRKNKNNTAFIYTALFQKNTDAKLTTQQIEKQEKTIYNLMLLSCNFDSDVATACGLFFVDSSIINKSEYVYKLSVYTASASITSNEVYTVNVNTSILSTNKKIVGFAGRSKNKTATLSWKAIDYKSDYAGYLLERSEDSVVFKKINTTPIILLSTQFEKNKEYIFYNDTMPQSNKKYFYRLKGINFFGEESDPSNIISCYSSPIINSVPLIDSIKVVQNKKVNIKWRMENNLETPLPKKYILLRAEKDNGKYQLLFEAKDNLRFVDLKPLTSNFYKVGAITFNNDTLFSYSRMAAIIDTIPPAIPNNLMAKVDKSGNVTIYWTKNLEVDLQGYKLFKANALSEEFVQVNNKFIKDTFYNDKLNLKTLSKKIYYALAASDNNFNTSLNCLPIAVKRPDTIPPASPILNSVTSDFKGAKLNFILSKSEDASKHIISRKNENEMGFVDIKVLNRKDSVEFFIDTAVQYKQVYTYNIRACDEDDNCATSKNVSLKYETGFRKKLTSLNYVVDRTQKSISLNWGYDEKEIEKFILYRAKESEPLTIIKTLSGNTLSYIDKTPNIGNVYEYRIKAVLSDGAESIISDPIKVIY